jgi:predicted PurR-regulated permease PerM
MSSETARPYRVAAFVVAAAALAVVVAWTVKALLVLFGGFLFALVLHGLAAALHRRTGTGYGACVASIVLALVIITAITITLIGPGIRTPFEELAKRLPGAIAEVLERMQHVPLGRALAPSPARPAPDAQAVASGAVFAIGTVLDVVGGLVIVFFIGVYGAARPEDYTRAVLAITPSAHRRSVRRVIRDVSANLTRWLLGRLVAMAFVGVTCAIAFAALGVPFAVTLALVAGLFTFVEYVGAILSAIPALILAFSKSPSSALGVLIVYTLIHLVEGYVLTPLLARMTVRFAPALTLAGQVLFTTLVGPLGLTFSTPVLIVAVSTMNAWRRQERSLATNRTTEERYPHAEHAREHA